jgi:catechol 2,3-dioxygenase-like lactoylglutathione lyase family enzyme
VRPALVLITTERDMTTRLDDPTTTDPVVRGILTVTMVLIVVGVLALVRATMGSSAHHVTVRVDNQTGLSVQVEALDPAGARVGLGEAEPTAVRTFHDVPDLGARWTFVAFYGGREVHRETVARAELAGRDWTVTIPADVTDALEQAGFQ